MVPSIPRALLFFVSFMAFGISFFRWRLLRRAFNAFAVISVSVFLWAGFLRISLIASCDWSLKVCPSLFS